VKLVKGGLDVARPRAGAVPRTANEERTRKHEDIIVTDTFPLQALVHHLLLGARPLVPALATTKNESKTCVTKQQRK
jgi:hypothetical protein